MRDCKPSELRCVENLHYSSPDLSLVPYPLHYMYLLNVRESWLLHIKHRASSVLIDLVALSPEHGQVPIH